MFPKHLGSHFDLLRHSATMRCCCLAETVVDVVVAGTVAAARRSISLPLVAVARDGKADFLIGS